MGSMMRSARLGMAGAGGVEDVEGGGLRIEWRRSEWGIRGGKLGGCG